LEKANEMFLLMMCCKNYNQNKKGLYNIFQLTMNQKNDINEYDIGEKKHDSI